MAHGSLFQLVNKNIAYVLNMVLMKITGEFENIRLSTPRKRRSLLYHVIT